MSQTSVEIQRLGPADVDVARRLNLMFGAAFGERDMYGQPLTDAYLRELLAKESLHVLVAMGRGEVVGGLVAYELDKLERMQREIYIYDLAVAESHRRNGIATALIEHLQDIAAMRRAWVIFVQADYEDDPAIALYEKLGTREEVLHFDVPVPRRERSA